MARIYLLLAAFLLYSLPGQTQKKSHRFYAVTKVVDGDTFWIDDGSEKGLKIRLIGIDAPEPVNAFRKKKEPFGEEASRFMEKLIAGKKVRIEYDVGPRDRYGRALVYAWLENGIFINAEMLRQGYAVVMTIPPNVKYADYFLKLQRKARKQKKGLWAIKK